MIRKFFKGFYFAWQGLTYAYRTQVNFRFHCLASLAVIGLCSYLELNNTEWLWVGVAIMLVLVTELINTAIELLVDLVSPEYNTKAGSIKDLSAAVVLISAIFALVVGILIILPKILHAS